MGESKRQEIAALRRVIDTFGADIVLHLNRPLERGGRQRLQDQLGVEQRVSACDACDLRAKCASPLPPWFSTSVSGERGARVAIIGEAPSWEEERAGELGHGRAGALVRKELERAGLDMDQVTWMNTVACHPSAGERKSRPPNAQEQETCRPHLMDALDAADVDYVLLLGAVAVRAWRGDVKLSDVHGGLYIWANRWMVTPVFHPNAVLRKDAEVEMSTWRKDIVRFAENVSGRHSLDSLGVKCVTCGATMYGWDEDGIAWCDAHFKQGAAGRSRRAKQRRNPNQGALL